MAITAAKKAEYEANWKQHASKFWLDRAYLGQTFERDGESWTILGLRLNGSPKAPVVVLSAKGKERGYSALTIKRVMTGTDVKFW